MKRWAISLAALLVAGCNIQSGNATNETVTINANQSGRVSFDLPFAKGQVQIPPSMMHSGNFDIDGVKLMPGSSMTGFNVNARDHGATVDMSFTAPASPDAVRSYFVDQFRRKGMQVALAGDAVTGKTKEGSLFAIHVGPAVNGSQGRIEIQAKG
jgi:hypothetical protein